MSLAELPRYGTGIDECYALLFESAFELAESDPEWATECLDDKGRTQWPISALAKLADRVSGLVAHHSLLDAMASFYAPLREQERRWRNQPTVAFLGDVWFWAGLVASVGIDEHHALWNFRVALAEAATHHWGDARLHTRLIREAPLRACTTPLRTLMAHPILRLGELKYPKTLEQTLLLRFLNARCIAEGFESEEDSFGSPLRLAQWVRDARTWAKGITQEEPETYLALLDEVGDHAIEEFRSFVKDRFGKDILQKDPIDLTVKLIACAHRVRGFEVSQYRAQLWELVVHVVDWALWLDWLPLEAAAK